MPVHGNANVMTIRTSRPVFALALFCLFAAIRAEAFTPKQHDAVIRLGELNGVALQCGYTADMRRMKHALVEAVPKVSQLGELYEDATRKSFLDMVQKNRPCPQSAPFAVEVDGAITALYRFFAQDKP